MRPLSPTLSHEGRGGTSPQRNVGQTSALALPSRGARSTSIARFRASTLPPSLAKRSILRPEQSISRISQAGHDVVVFVQPFIQRADVHKHIGMMLLVYSNALRGSDEREKQDVLRRHSMTLQHLHRVRTGISSADHRVADDEGAALDLG